jgi:glutathione S-transferase
MDYVVGTVHMRGFSRLFVPAAFSNLEAQYLDVVATGRKIAEKGLEIIDAGLADRTYVTGSYSFADAALFYVECWSEHFSVPLPPNCMRHYATMLQRPAVQRVLAADQRK